MRILEGCLVVELSGKKKIVSSSLKYILMAFIPKPMSIQSWEILAGSIFQ
jgi:hypothetical protein